MIKRSISSRTGELTTLPNRRSLATALTALSGSTVGGPEVPIKTSSRKALLLVSVATVDEVNNTLGASLGDELLRVEEGSLYPALHRMEQNRWVASEWATTETNRKAKYYKLTAAGRKQLQETEKNFEQLVKGVRAILRYA